jgi:hypothetical protein
MNPNHTRYWIAGLTGVSLCLVAAGATGILLTLRPPARAEPPQVADSPKTSASALPAGLDLRKSTIESPTERLLAAMTSTGFANPKVEPGRVHWHTDFAAARAAAAKSGKPVLLFQMMGKLDDQFC